MTQKSLSRAAKLFGTDMPDGKKRILTAGPISAVLDNGSLRYIAYNGTEVLRGIAYLVRDKNWGTYSPVIENLKIRQGKGSFAVGYRATCSDAQQTIRYEVKIEGAANGVVRFSAEATPVTDVLTNRTGFVVLHPLSGTVGAPVEVVHTDGKKEKTKFPKFISPGQPVFEIRSLKHTVMPGLTATVLMEGNKFEMEDHRNWMDASYKTYVCSLLDPWPYTLKAGATFNQSVTLTVEGKPKTKPRKSSSAITIDVGQAKGRIPPVGLSVAMDEAEETLAAIEALRTLAPAHLTYQMDGRKAGQAEAAALFRALKEKTNIPATLEIILPAQAPAMEEMAAMAAALRAGGFAPDAIVVTQMHDLKSFQPNTPRPWGPSYEDMATAARRHFPKAAIGGGMLSFFTELNRKPVPMGVFDFITHSVCPIVHTADDISVMETLQSMPSITASVRNMIGKTPYHIGPSSIACRDNPYGAAVAPNPDNGRVCLSDDDPRQRGVFAAAWNLALVAASARGGVNAVTLGAVTGARGVVTGHGLVPAFHVLAGLAGSAGAVRLEAQSTSAAEIEALAYRSKNGRTLWLANLTGETRIAKVQGLAGSAEVHVISDGAFRMLSSAPDFTRKAGQKLKRVGAVTLPPYAVARIVAG
jgi:D-apionolactonase